MDSRFALLLNDGEGPHMGSCQILRKYMVDEAGFDQRNIAVHSCPAPLELLAVTEGYFSRLNRRFPSAPVVVYYSGHGIPGSFEFSDKDDGEGSDGGRSRRPLKYGTLPHSMWARMLVHEGPLFLLVESCHGGSIMPALRNAGLVPGRSLAIASSRSREVSWGNNFLDAVLDCYRRKQPFHKGRLDLPPLEGGYAIAVAWRRYQKSLLVSINYAGQGMSRVVIPSKVPPYLLPPPPSPEPADKAAPRSFVVSAAFVPDPLPRVMHPVRCGLDLDYLLYASK